MSKYLWLKVTRDKYELPIAVAGSASELAAILGVSRWTVFNGYYDVRDGVRKRSCYVRVIDPDFEDEVGGVL